MSTTPSDFAGEFERYRGSIQTAANERERAQYFIELLGRLPELDDDIADKVGYPADIRPELEKYMKGQQQARNRKLSEFGTEGTEEESEEGKETVFVDVSGRLDARVGNLVIEFKDDLNAEISSAKEQLRRYVYLLREEEGIKEDFLCLATDGELFITYEILLPDQLDRQEDITLSQLTSIDSRQDDTREIHRWLKTLFADRIRPIVEELDSVFGVDSDTFERSIQILQEAFEESERAPTHRKEWADYLEFAQGAAPSQDSDLYLRHTYLASFAKLLSYMVFTKGSMPSIEDAKEVLRGEVSAFPDNLFEQDLFSWIGHTETGDRFVDLLIDRLLQFNLGRVDQDVFKKLYQDMVSYEVRHDLGEYYTPDWLAKYITEDKLDIEAGETVLDPGCGSGTFLVECIRLKREKSDKPPKELVVDLPQEVVGLDIHPLAVMIAKANYVASIEDLLQYRREQIQIPVYLSDSILFEEELREPDVVSGIEVRGPITISDEDYYMPQKAIENPAKLDTVLGLIPAHLESGEGFEWKVAQTVPEFDDLVPIFEDIRANMALADKEGRDSIHAFILRNFFRPLFMSDIEGFDVLIGNPPFLSYNQMSGTLQQDQSKELAKRYGLNPGVENIPNMDLATIFIVRCIDLFLKDTGRFGFVMPRSIFTADQHHKFRQGNMTVEMDLTTVLDLENVSPLFNIPAGAIIGQKGQEWGYPIAREIFQGEFPLKNVDWNQAKPNLDISESEIVLGGSEDKSSWDELPDLDRSVYYSRFSKGGEITPRSFWFIELQEEGRKFGFNQTQPPVQTSEYGRSSPKNKAHQVQLEGEIESKFFYQTLIGGDIVPFTHASFRNIILPVESEGTKLKLIRTEEARSGGSTGLANWLTQAEHLWGLVDKRVDNLFEAVDYRNKITRQDPDCSYKVLSLDSGTDLSACVVDMESIGEESEFEIQAFIADMKTYYYETDDRMEAYFLSGILNSNFMNYLIKNLQSKGLFGERDIKKNPYEFPIPNFNENNPDHRKIAELAEACEEQADSALEKGQEQYKATWRIRQVVRDELEDEITKIDQYTENILYPDRSN